LRFIEDIKIGDYILVAQGANWQKKLFIGGIVISEALYDQIEGTPGKAYYRKLAPYLTQDELEKLNLDFKGSAYVTLIESPPFTYYIRIKMMLTKKLTETLHFGIQEHLNKKNMNEKIELLKYKHQIILQGPPGTGKTFTAQQMAKEMTLSKKKLTPLQYIEHFIKNYIDNKQSKELRASNNILLNEFMIAFPAKELKI